MTDQAIGSLSTDGVVPTGVEGTLLLSQGFLIEVEFFHSCQARPKSRVKRPTSSTTGIDQKPGFSSRAIRPLSPMQSTRSALNVVTRGTRRFHIRDLVGLPGSGDHLPTGIPQFDVMHIGFG